MILLLLGITFEGRVVDADGDPVVGAEIGLYDVRFRRPSDITTDADGRFSAELPPGPRRVRVLPPRLSSSSEIWLGDTLQPCDSPLVDPEQTPGVEIDLPPGSAIQGSVFRPDRTPYAQATIEAYPVWSTELPVAVRQATTDVDGNFLITGLPPDGSELGYRLRIVPGAVPEQFYRSVWDEEDATLVPVEPGGVVDLEPFSLRPGVSLSGQVSGPAGPVEGAKVFITGSWPVSLETDADGHWEAHGIPQGEIELWAEAPGLARAWFGEQPRDSLMVAPDTERVDGVDFQLTPEAVVEGTAPQLIDSDALVTIRSSLGDQRATQVDDQGAYRFTNLGPGDYDVEVISAEPVGLVSTKLVDDLSLTSGETVDVGNATLVIGGRLQGTVFDDFGEPVSGAAVIAQATGLGPRMLTFTRDDGSYTLPGIAPGLYALNVGHGTFCNDDPTYVTVYWPSQINPTVTRSIEIDSGQTMSWDVVMPRDADGDGMGDAWEIANGLDVEIDDADLDPDGDGFSNLDEYYLGTDPQQLYVKETCGCSSDAPGLGWLSAFARRGG